VLGPYHPLSLCIPGRGKTTSRGRAVIVVRINLGKCKSVRIGCLRIKKGVGKYATVSGETGQESGLK